VATIRLVVAYSQNMKPLEDDHVPAVMAAHGAQGTDMVIIELCGHDRNAMQRYREQGRVGASKVLALCPDR
jgi:hypothetical protein